MRKLAVNTFLTLDGVMQAPGGPEEDRSGGFEQGGWSVNYWDDMMGKTMDEFSKVPFDLLLGRKTYEIFAAHWPQSKEEPMAGVLNRATKHVASRTLRSLDWQNSKLIEGDVPKAVAQLKKEDGPEIQVHGSSDLIQTLLEHDLIDEFRIWTFPVAVGGGKRLFGRGTMPRDMKLTDSKQSTTGVRIDTYRRGGPVKTGSFMHEQPTEAEKERRVKVARER